MSTKTTFKRVALVAVASLGLGVLTSVSANAASTFTSSTVTNISGTGTSAAPLAVGSTVTADLNAVIAVDTGSAISGTATWTLTDPNSTTVTSEATFTANPSPTTGVTTSFTGAVNTIGVSAAVAAATEKVGTISFVAKSAGIYTLSAVGGGTNGGGNALDGTISIYVSGSGAVTAASGKGTTTIGAVSGGIAVVKFVKAAGHGSSDVYNLTSTGVGVIQSVANASSASAPTVAGIAGTTDWTQGAKVTSAADTYVAVNATVASNVAGTQTLTWTSISSTNGAPTVVATQVITWGAAPALSVANSTSVLQAGIGANSATSDATVLASKTATNVANVAVTLNDGNGLALNGQKLTVSVDGPGLIGVDVNSVNGVGNALTNRIYADSSANAGNVWQIGVTSDGTAGTSRITISVGTTVIAVETVTFYGAVSKLVATNNLIAVADGSVTTDAVNVCAVDSNGNVVPGATIYATSADSTIASVAASAVANASSTAVVEDYDTGTADPATGNNPLVNTAYRSAKANGCAGFSVTAASQTAKDSVVLTFRDAALAADATVSTTSTVKVGGKSAATVTLTSDKDSYAAGAKGTMTLTFKDSTGRLVGAGAGTGTLTGALTSSASLQGAALFAANNDRKLGVVTADVYFPWNAGSVVITGTTGTNSTFLDSAARSAGISKSIKVTAAADSTSAQIASLISKINALSKLIAKIQKKLGIK